MTTLSNKAIKAIGQWIADQDTGVSSETMVAVSLGAKKSKTSRFDAPHDPSDFGRCYRLVKAVPEVKTQFAQIGKVVPTFKLILENWDDLCALYPALRKTPGFSPGIPAPEQRSCDTELA